MKAFNGDVTPALTPSRCHRRWPPSFPRALQKTPRRAPSGPPGTRSARLRSGWWPPGASPTAEGPAPCPATQRGGRRGPVRQPGNPRQVASILGGGVPQAIPWDTRGLSSFYISINSKSHQKVSESLTRWKRHAGNHNGHHCRSLETIGQILITVISSRT